MSSAAAPAGPMRAELIRRLEIAFAPGHLEVIDESHQHSVPTGTESHFKVVIVSEAFEPMARVARHRAVHEQAADMLAAGLHALSIQAHTPAEWVARGDTIAPSPRCRRGSKAMMVGRSSCAQLALGLGLLLGAVPAAAKDVYTLTLPKYLKGCALSPN